MITQEQINKAIQNCIWRQEVGEVYICRGDVCPCEKHIAEGRCITLIELFNTEGKE